jgi:hypothetical protein
MDEVLRKADNFAAANTSAEAFDAAVKKDKIS